MSYEMERKAEAIARDIARKQGCPALWVFFLHEAYEEIRKELRGDSSKEDRS